MADSNAKFDELQAARFAALALGCVHKEYPNKIAHSLNSDADVRPPRELTPVFFGCYDWHSAVHGHWLLVRLSRLFPNASFFPDAMRSLNESFTRPKIAGEVSYVTGKDRYSFERPYGLAWLLQLVAELKEWGTPEARQWSAALSPLESAVTGRLSDWLPKLEHPIRTGEHNNTAFSLGLMLDYARIMDNPKFGQLVESRVRAYYVRDKDCPISYEPSGEDFLSPCLAEADVVRRIMPPGDFGPWFNNFLRHIDLQPTYVSDPSDGKLGHLVGLNLSRAWMLEGIVSKLPSGDGRKPQLSSLADKLREAGLSSITSEHYEGTHWLGAFAVYLVSSRGLQ
ncbi:MAG: DUF2891 domain-containing protein [Bryobacteraceae bacterium]